MEKKNNRKILEYFTCENKEHWLREIQKSDWGAGQYLYSLLKENKLKALVGATTLVLMLADGDKLVSFCTLAPLDDVQPLPRRRRCSFISTARKSFSSCKTSCTKRVISRRYRKSWVKTRRSVCAF